MYLYYSQLLYISFCKVKKIKYLFYVFEAIYEFIS